MTSHNVVAQRNLAEVAAAFRQIRHDAEIVKNVEIAKQTLPILAAAKTLVERNPEFALWGSDRIIAIAGRMEKSSGRLTMAGISYVFTISRVAEMLGWMKSG